MHKYNSYNTVQKLDILLYKLLYRGYEKTFLDRFSSFTIFNSIQDLQAQTLLNTYFKQALILCHQVAAGVYLDSMCRQTDAWHTFLA